jgi:hypothetical protein
MNTNTAEQSRIEGAKVCMLALAKMIESAEAFNVSSEKLTNNAESAARYYDARLHDAKAVADAIGSLSPYQEGAIIALAEYIHSYFTTGEPNLEVWAPCVAMTADQYRDEVAATAAALED